MAGKPRLVPLLTATCSAVVQTDRGIPSPHPAESVVVSDAIFICNPMPPEPFSESSAAHLATRRLSHSPGSVRFRVTTAWNGKQPAVVIAAYVFTDGCSTSLPPDEGTLLWKCVASPAVTVPELLENYRYKVSLPDAGAVLYAQRAVAARWYRSLKSGGNVYRMETPHVFPGSVTPATYLRVEAGWVYGCTTLREASTAHRGSLITPFTLDAADVLLKMGVDLRL